MRGAAESGGRRALLMLLMLSTTAALFLGRPAGSSPATFRLCGKKLADLLSLICRERGFYDPFAPKPAHARGEPFRENRLGVSDECCRMGCTEATLKSYCAPSEDDYGDPELEFVREHQQVVPASRGNDDRREAEGSPTAGVSTGSKVSRGGKRRKGGGGGGGGRKRGGARARWPRGDGKGKRCRCRRRRRKTDAEAVKRQMSHPSFQIGTIPPSFLGTPVILSRTRVIS